MDTNHIPAVFGLNKYLWDKLSTSVEGNDPILNPADYAGLIPIVPLQEVPQLLQAIDSIPGITSVPYITYLWYTNGFTADSWYQPTDTVIYTIYATDQKRLRQIVLMATRLFKQFDKSAQAVNSFITSAYPAPVPPAVDGPSASGYQYRAYSYNYISVSASTGGVPVGLENDAIPASITVRVNYTSSENDLPLP
jgi:hypothetical protein